MRTAEEFNNTYDLICEGGGLVIDVPAVVQFLNVAFADFIKIDGFRYTQVSTVRGIPRVDTNLTDIMPYVGHVIHSELEDKISLILKVEFEVEERLRSINLDKNGKPLEI